MGPSLLRRSVIAAAVAGLTTAFSLMPAQAATFRAAATGQMTDATGDASGRRPVPVQDPRVDLTAARATVGGDGRIELTASVVQPTDPATDPGWTDGQSYLIWQVDTTADGSPDYLVTMGKGPAGIVAGVLRNLTEVQGCDPVASYTPARYSVIFSASCIGSPAGFGWNALLAYGPERNDAFKASDNLVGDHQATLAPGAVNDPVGDVITHRDVNDPRADITSATIDYQPGRIDLTATLDRATDPRSDPNWAGQETEVSWEFDTDGDDETDYVAAIGATPDLTVTVYDTGGGNSSVMCAPTATFTPAGYALTLHPSCIRSPARLWWSVHVLYTEDGQGAVDTAPDLSMAGPVSVGADGGPQSGYWMLTRQGDVFAFGDARPLGGGTPCCGSQRVDIEPTPSGNGYWILDALGSVLTKGDAVDFGDVVGQRAPDERAAAISATPAGDGYWIFTDRGRVFAYGAARHQGDMAGVALNGPILDSVATPTGKGYWMVASDGGIFSFGDAAFSGSTGNLKLNQPVMSMAADPDGRGYWLVASDGGIFAFDAPFHGSMGAATLNKPISGMVPGNAGYLMVGEDGGIFAFGDVGFHGSLGDRPPSSPVVSVALAG